MKFDLILSVSSLVLLLRSVKGLVSRGLVQQEKGTNKGDPYYQGLLAASCRACTPAGKTNFVLGFADMLFFTMRRHHEARKYHANGGAL